MKARKATAAEKKAVAAFVPGLLRVTSDGKVALFAVGSKTRQRFARENESMLAIFEFLAKQEPPPGTYAPSRPSSTAWPARGAKSWMACGASLGSSLRLIATK